MKRGLRIQVQLGKRTLLARSHNPACLIDAHWYTIVGLWEVESTPKPKENGTEREFIPAEARKVQTHDPWNIVLQYLYPYSKLHGCRAWHERYNHPTIASPVIKDNDHKPLKSIIFKSFSRAPRRLLITPLKLQYRKSVKRHAYKKEVQVSTSRSYLSLHLSPVKAVLRPLWIISALSSVFLFPSLWTLEFKRKRFIFCQEIS